MGFHWKKERKKKRILIANWYFLAKKKKKYFLILAQIETKLIKTPGKKHTKPQRFTFFQQSKLSPYASRPFWFKAKEEGIQNLFHNTS